MIACVRRRVTAVLILCGGLPCCQAAFALPNGRAADRPTPPPPCTVGGPADTVRNAKFPTAPNPNWGRDTLKAVRARQVCSGMNEDMVRSAWGFPPLFQIAITPSGKVVRLLYPDYVVVLEHDRVTSVTPARANARRFGGGA